MTGGRIVKSSLLLFVALISLILISGYSYSDNKSNNLDFTWTQFSENSPSGRTDHNAVYDSSREVIVMYGGTSTSPKPETWEFDGSNWEQIDTTLEPSARYESRIVFDERNEQLVLYGGFNGSHLGDTWIGTSNISIPTPTNTPTPIPTPCDSISFSEVAGSAGVANSGSGNGCTWLDYDGDGDQDLLVLNDPGSGGLYRNNGDETFTNVTSSAGITTNGNHVLAADFNNDGDVDVLFNRGNNTFLYSNNGGIFVDVSDSSGIDSLSSGVFSVLDYDLDGKVDIIYISDKIILYHNETGLTFTDKTENAGLSEETVDIEILVLDYDNDADDDLYLIYRESPDALYMNNGDGTFTNVTAGSGIEADTESDRFGGIGDINNDGYMDIFIAREYNQPNALLKNNGDGTFTDIAETAGVTLSSSGNDPWAAQMLQDFNNDGWIDILMGAGRYGDAVRLYQNQRDGTFVDVAAAAGINNIQDTHNYCVGDFNNDGNLDFYRANFTGCCNSANQLYKGDENCNHWLIIKLIGTTANASGIGTRVKVIAGDNSYYRELICKSLGGMQLPLHFGLGSYNGTVDIEVTWPGGSTQVESNISVDRICEITQTHWYDSYDFSSKGCVAYWPFDGDSQDKASNLYHGTLQGGPTYANSPYGQCLLSDGQDDYVKISNEVPYDEVTMAGWVKKMGPSYLDCEFTIFRRMADCNFAQHGLHVYDSNNQISFYGNNIDPELTWDAPSLLGEWHHICATFKSGEKKLYFDGQLKASNTVTGFFVRDAFHACYIGGCEQYTYGGLQSLNGYIDEVVVFNRVLSESEVADLSSDSNSNIIADFWEYTPIPGENCALQFDGVDDFINIDDGGFLSFEASQEPYTVSCWVNMTSLPTYGDAEIIIDRNKTFNSPTSYTIYYRSIDSAQGEINSFQFLMWNGYEHGANFTHVTGTTKPTINKWYHIAVVLDTTTIKLYVNGSLEDQGDIYFGGTKNTEGTSIGRFAGAYYGNYLNGKVDEVRIWNIARTQTEIQQDMFHKLSGDEPGLVAYWNFDEGAGQLAYDLTINGNNGRLGSSSGSDDSDPIWVSNDLDLTPPLDVNVSAHIEPSDPGTLDDLECVTSVENTGGYPDLSTSYRWFCNGLELTDGMEINGEFFPVTDAFLSHQFTTKNETFFCSPSITDGTSFLTTYTDPVTIKNSTPTAPVVEIRPPEPVAGEDLGYNVLVYSTDPDGDEVYYRTDWYESEDSGETWIHKIELTNLPFISGSVYIQDGDLWRLEITPYEVDSIDKNLAKNADIIEGLVGWDQVYVGENTRPTVIIDEPATGLTIAYPNTKIAWHTEDADGDTVTVSLYYDSDVVEGGEILIASDLPGEGIFMWEPPFEGGEIPTIDISGNGKVDVNDLFLLATNWQIEVDGTTYRIFARAWDTKKAIGESFSNGKVMIPNEVPANKQGLMRLFEQWHK